MFKYLYLLSVLGMGLWVTNAEAVSSATSVACETFEGYVKRYKEQIIGAVKDIAHKFKEERVKNIVSQTEEELNIAEDIIAKQDPYECEYQMNRLLKFIKYLRHLKHN